MVQKKAFDILEDYINDYSIKEPKALDQYFSLDDYSTNMNKNAGDILKYQLSISAVLDNIGLRNSYFYLGGGATLVHLVDNFGFDKMKKWRGTHDLDIVLTNYGLRNTLEHYYDYYNEDKSLSIPGKKKISILDDSLSTKAEIDLYMPNKKYEVEVDGHILEDRLLNELKTEYVLGVPVRVIKIHDLINSKLNVHRHQNGLPREKDIIDIENLISCVEVNKGIANKYKTLEDKATYLVKKIKLNNRENLEQLYNVVDLINRDKYKDYIVRKPTKKYLSQIMYKLDEVLN